MSVEGGEPKEAKPLRLDQFLKLNGITETGGQAKVLIQDGQVKVNGDVETRRSRKLFGADVVEVGGEEFPLDDFLSNS